MHKKCFSPECDGTPDETGFCEECLEDIYQMCEGCGSYEPDCPCKDSY